MLDRSEQLNSLIESLDQLVGMLACDPSCQWRDHFQRCLIQAEELKSKGFDQSSLNELSGSIRSVFGGMASFNDYMPAQVSKNGTVTSIVGMENFDQISGAVYANALNLMVIGAV